MLKINSKLLIIAAMILLSAAITEISGQEGNCRSDADCPPSYTCQCREIPPGSIFCDCLLVPSYESPSDTSSRSRGDKNMKYTM